MELEYIPCDFAFWIPTGTRDMAAVNVSWGRLAATLLLACLCSSAQASDIDRRKGLGYAGAIGGPTGLAFSYGVGNLSLETIIGFSRFAFADDEPKPILFIAAGLAAHFQLLSAENAAVTIGGRFNIGTGTAAVTLRDTSGIRQATEQQEITQFGFDVPLRVYWFPDRHISIHTEFGLAVYMGPEDAVLFDVSDGDAQLEPAGLAIVAFRHAAPFGQLGLTYWW